MIGDALPLELAPLSTWHDLCNAKVSGFQPLVLDSASLKWDAG
jgi:hypothetical protein